MLYLIILIIFSVILIYSIFIEPFFFKINNREIYSPKIKKNIKILHLSDLHLKKNPSLKLINLLKRIKKLNPDLILFTGDFSENDNSIKYLNKIFIYFSHIPIYSVLGNHDFYTYSIFHLIKPYLFKPKPRNVKKIYPILKQNNISVLNNNSKLLFIKKNMINIIGLKYIDHIDKNPLYDFTKLSKKYYNIVIAHSPDLIKYLKKEDYNKIDLILFGHTHGGQVRIPFLGHIFSRTKYSYHLTDSFHLFNNTFINTNRGLGQGFNIRFFCRPEAVFINVKAL